MYQQATNSTGIGQDVVILAQEEGARRYLLVAAGDEDNPQAPVRILDLDAGTLSQPHPLMVILGQGYWQVFKGDQDILQAFLENVKPRPGAPDLDADLDSGHGSVDGMEPI